MKLVLRVVTEALRLVRAGSKSTGRTVRICVLFVVLVGGSVAAVAFLGVLLSNW